MELKKGFFWSDRGGGGSDGRAYILHGITNGMCILAAIGIHNTYVLCTYTWVYI